MLRWLARPVGGVPRSVAVYTAGLAIVACAAAAVAPGGQATPHWFGVVALLGTLVVAGSLQLEFRYGKDVEALDVFDAVLALAIFALSPPLTVAAVAVAKLTSQGFKGVQPIKLAFNTAQWAAAAGVGSLVFHAAGGHGLLTRANVALLAAAMVAASAVNHLAVVGVLRLSGRGSIRQVLTALAPVMLSGWVLAGVVNLAFGFIFVAAWSASPWATPLFLVPLGLLHWANRNYAEARADRSRLAGLQQATQNLLEPVDPRTALPAFLADVRTTFEVGVAELVLSDGDGPATVHHLDADRHTIRALSGPEACAAWATAAETFTQATAVTPGSIEAEVARALVGGGEWHHGLVAPIRSDDRLTGFVCVHDRLGLHGFAHGELAVLDVLAAEVGNGFRKGELLDVILDERRQFAEIVNQTADGIATLALDGRVLSWNPGFARISGFSHDDLRTETGIDRLAARDGDGHAIDLKGWARTATLPTEIEVSTNDGQRRWLACSYSHVGDPAGTSERLILIARDVTGSRMLRQAQDQLRAADARLQAVRQSEERVSVLLRNASDVVAVLDQSGNVTYASHHQPSPKLVTAPQPGQPWETIVHPDDQEQLRTTLASTTVEPGATARVEYRLASTDGRWRQVETTVTNLLGRPPVDGLVLNTKDITDRKQADALLASETAILDLIAREEALDEILRRILASVEAQIHGARAVIALVDRQRTEVVAGPGVGPLARATVAAQAQTRHAQLTGLEVTAHDDEPRITSDDHWALHPLTGSDGTTLGFLCLDQPELAPAGRGLLGLFAGLAVVAVERHRSRAHLTHQATHDGLTGLPNRSTFLDRTSMALARSRRSGSWVAVLYCDLDRFKAINDTYGHDAGDQLLVAFAQRVLGAVRPGDTAARLGGDEFSILCEDLHHPIEATTIAERLRSTLAEPFDVAGHRLTVPPSIGVAVVGGGGNTHDVLERADAAMYRAKRNGGNQWELTELVAQIP